MRTLYVVATAAWMAMAASPALSRARFPVLSPDWMTPAQKAVADSVMRSRKNLAGPFNAWLRSPELADRLQKVGEYVRYHSALPPALSELAILVTARQWRSREEWDIHYPAALDAGLPASLLAADRRPRGMTADQALVYDVCLGLHRDKARIPDPLFRAMVARFGEQGMIDLVGLAGYYATVSMTLNVAAGPR
jgi:4-carboxymuconolactone decarboxylase